MAALTNLKLAVIGTGGMAKLFTRILRGRFKEIAIISRDPKKAEKLSRRLGVSYAKLSDLKQFDILLFTTPSQHLPNMVKAVSQNLKAEALVMDVSSVKVGIVEKVAEALPSSIEYISLHPLFAPSTRKIQGNNLVMIPIRGELFLNMMKRLFEELGLRVVVSSPEEHDKIMALVQVAHHLSYLSLALTLWNFLGSERLDPYVTRSLRKTFSMFKMFSRNLKVIKEISSLNSYKAWAINELMNSMKRLEEGDEQAWRAVEKALEELSKLSCRELVE